jgi:hypothetical protein
MAASTTPIHVRPNKHQVKYGTLIPSKWQNGNTINAISAFVGRVQRAGFVL